MQSLRPGLLTDRTSASGALFDGTGRYRYLLWRCWQPELPTVSFLMLNPSTAGAENNDPTISRCVAFAKRWGFGAMEAVNLFAYRLTDSRLLAKVRNPVGKHTDRCIADSARRSILVVCAWGNCGAIGDRSKQVVELLHGSADLRCFGLTKQGHPRHPLYLRREEELVPFVPDC